MTKKETTEQFMKYVKLLHKLSHQTASRCERPEADVYGQACFLFMKAASGYRKDRGAFGTYMFVVVKNGLASWGVKNDLPPDPEMYVEPQHEQHPRRALEFKEWLANLSEEVREVAMIILNGPMEILDIPFAATPKQVRGALYRYLRGKGWEWKKVWGTIREMKSQVALIEKE